MDIIYHVIWNAATRKLVPDTAFGAKNNGLVLNWTLNFNADIHSSCWATNAGDLRSIILELLTNYQNSLINALYDVCFCMRVASFLALLPLRPSGR